MTRLAAAPLLDMGIDMRCRALVAVLLFVSCGDDSLQRLPNEPEMPRVEQTVGAAPVARIAPLASPFPTPSTVRLDGRGSSDPDGTIIAHVWRVLSAPAGNANAPAPSNSPSPDFIVGLAGRYVVGLRVQDDDGNISPEAIATFDAAATEAIHVELTWDYSDNDVDLHLLRGNASIADPVNDCYYANCIGDYGMVDWGVAGSPHDDPSLDLDNIGSTVPENINLDQPEAGELSVVVNYFSDAGAGAAHPTVRIYINGALRGTFGPVTLDASCVKWRPARISMPSGSVTPDGSIWTEATDCMDGWSGY